MDEEEEMGSDLDEEEEESAGMTDFGSDESEE
jgi:hypothetical protein